MKYKVKLFDFANPDEKLEQYLNEYQIDPKNIINISFSCDAYAHERWGRTNVKQILLVYMEDGK